MTYATTRARSGVSGEVLFVARKGTWQNAQSPAAEMVLLILRTPKGRCLVRPEMGVDWRRVNKLRTDAGNTARAAVLDALGPLVQTGYIADPRASVRVYPTRGYLELDVSFVDVRLRAATRTTLPTLQQAV